MSDSFRTKTGHARVSAHQIVIERTGVRGGVAQRVQGNSKVRTLVVYAVLSVLLGWQGWSAYRDGRTVFAVFAFALVAWIAYALFRSRRFTMAPVVERDTTTRVVAVRGFSGLTRDRLIVHFNEGAEEVERYILMPGVLQNGRGELDRALALLKQAGWPLEKSVS